MFDWDDGTTTDWLGPFESDVSCEGSHDWNANGDYNIKVKAKDILGAESEWSEPLKVTIPRTRSLSFDLLDWLFERFPNLFPILRQILILH
jgi:hypothetical protein